MELRPDEKYRVMYDRKSRLYDLPDKLMYAVRTGWYRNLQMEWMGEVEVPESNEQLIILGLR